MKKRLCRHPNHPGPEHQHQPVFLQRKRPFIVIAFEAGWNGLRGSLANSPHDGDDVIAGEGILRQGSFASTLDSPAPAIETEKPCPLAHRYISLILSMLADNSFRKRDSASSSDIFAP